MKGPLEKLAEHVEPEDIPVMHRIAGGLLATLAGVLATWGTEKAYEAWRTRNDEDPEETTNQ